MYSNNPIQPKPIEYGVPNILYRNDSFLSIDEIKKYQGHLLSKTWGFSHDGIENIMYMSKDLYHHYKWDGNWDSARWLDDVPVDWEHLYLRIATHLPKHYLHWCDSKITTYGWTGTTIHRDKDPWKPGGDTEKFISTISILCNLNTNWDEKWGGGFQLYSADESGLHLSETVPIVPGQLLIMDNCFHGIEPITEPGKTRISCIFHVLKYR